MALLAIAYRIVAAVQIALGNSAIVAELLWMRQGSLNIVIFKPREVTRVTAYSELFLRPFLIP